MYRSLVYHEIKFVIIFVDFWDTTMQNIAF